MDLYLTSLAIGGMGLVAMAFSGFGRHGQHSASTHSGISHGGSSHGGTSHGGHSHGAPSHANGSHASHAGSHATGHGSDHGAAHNTTHGGNTARSEGVTASNALLSIMSPRVLFSVCLGLGTTGLLLRNTIGSGLPLFAAALVGGILFERLLVTPIWNFTFRFASNPALTLESALMGEATAVTRFDANGQGLIAIEVDGHLVQLLGTLQKTDIPQLGRVQVGARLRVEDVDSARNRCTVSLL